MTYSPEEPSLAYTEGRSVDRTVPEQHQSSRGRENNRLSYHRGNRETEDFLGEESPKAVCWVESVPRGHAET